MSGESGSAARAGGADGAWAWGGRGTNVGPGADGVRCANVGMRSADGQEGKRAQQNRSANEARGKRRPGKARGAAEEPSAQGCREERSTGEKKRREAKDREDQPERRGKNASGRHGTKRHERGTTGCRTKSLENGSNDVPAGKPGQRGQDRNYEPQPRKWCGTGAGTALEGCGNGEAADKRIGSPRKRRAGRRNRTRP